MDNYTQNKEITFRDVVLGAEQKVLEILSKELRLSKKIIPMGEHRSELVIEEEDTRESFIQAVQGMGLILKPYFDEQMEKAYGDFDELVDLFYFEFYIKHKEFVENTFKIMGDNFETEEKKVTQKTVEAIFQRYSIRKAKLIFRELNLLLKRQDYLKNAIYGDTETNDDIIEDTTSEDVE